MWVGGNFLFGRNRSGNFSLLRSLGLRYGFRAEQIDPVRYRDFVVSSTRVRRLITEGRVDEAAALLGHYHFVDGTVVAGAGREPRHRHPDRQPDHRERAAAAAGVYATAVTIGRTVHRAITNIGVRPTFETGGAATIETHVFGLDEDLYGRELRLSFVLRLRAEQTFPDVATLVAVSAPTAPRRRRSSIACRPSIQSRACPGRLRGSGSTAPSPCRSPGIRASPRRSTR